MSRPRWYELTTDEQRAWLTAQGEPAFRLKQLRHWCYRGRAASFEAMRDLPAQLRQQLHEHFTLFPGQVVAHQRATDNTEKLLLELPDGSQIECVLMRETSRRTICISTQVGCGMGCVFCASGLQGLKRNLTAGEILEQILCLDRLLPAGESLTNVVVMGIGEPLQNLPNLFTALDALTAEDGLALSPRRITVSTVGLPAKMREFAAAGRPYNLAVSLHAPNAALRSQLVPINDKVGLHEVLAAADEYFAITGRRVTYEYVLLGGVNDGPEHARELVSLLSSRIAHVNLIPMNEVSETDFHAPLAPRTQAFLDILLAAGLPATVRKRKGADIDAACGQLRQKRLTATTYETLPVVSLSALPPAAAATEK